MSRALRRCLSLLAGAAALGLVAGSAPAGPAVDEQPDIVAHPFPAFRIGRPEITDFGRLTFIGGFEFTADTRRVGGLSGLVVREEGRSLTAITDDGLALVARIERDGEGRPTGFAGARLRGMRQLNPDGSITAIPSADAEALDIDGEAAGSTLWVTLESVPRVMRGTIDGEGFPGPLSHLPVPERVRRLRWSKGLEALAVAPADGPLRGKVVTIAERPPRSRDDGERPGWILGEDGWAEFRVADSGFDVTDAAFGPDGDLYLLERLYTPAEGVRMRIRRIAVEDLAEGAVVDGAEVMSADLSHQIDNMEAMDIWSAPDGRTILSLMSDDNRSLFQRSIYLEFELRPGD